MCVCVCVCVCVYLYIYMLTGIVFVETCLQSHFFIFLIGRCHLLMSGTNTISYIFLIEMTFVNGQTQTQSVYI